MSPAHGAPVRHATVPQRFHFARTGAPPRPAPPLQFFRLLRRQPLLGFGSAPATSPLRRSTRNGRRFESVRGNRSTRTLAGESRRPFACTSQPDSYQADPRAALDRSEHQLREPSPPPLLHPVAWPPCSPDPGSKPTRLPVERGPRVQFVR